MLSERTAELATRVASVQRHIVEEARRVGRDPGEITLIAVTKTFPIDDVRRLAALGIHDFGENRHIEAKAKAQTLPQLRWHFIGRLQRNKASAVAEYSDVVHSVDRPELVPLLQRGAGQRRERPLDVLIQVSLDGDPKRGGVEETGVIPLADLIVKAEELHLRGVMTIAPRRADPEEMFAQLAHVSTQLQAHYPHARAISAGMSSDLAAAIHHGATHLRIGTALLGRRPPVVG